MKILFLDLDGVLNSHAYLVAHPGCFARVDLIDMLDPAACDRLWRVLEATGAGLVISSSWRIGRTQEEIQALLHRRGIDAEVLGMTPTSVGSERGHEIQAWLDGHPEVDRFVIVDDNSDMAHLREHLVQTSWAMGLLDHHVDELVFRLNRHYPNPSRRHAMNKLNTEESLRQLMTTYTELHRLFCTSSKGEVASVTPSGNGWKIDFSEISSSVGSDQFCATTLDELALKGLQLLQTELEGRMGAQGKVLTDLTRVHTEILLRLKTIAG